MLAAPAAISPSAVTQLPTYPPHPRLYRYLGKKVQKAVVTVPAYFNDSQRQATKVGWVWGGGGVGALGAAGGCGAGGGDGRRWWWAAVLPLTCAAPSPSLPAQRMRGALRARKCCASSTRIPYEAFPTNKQP